MPLRVACQMDPIERIDIRGDSTFAILLEAQKRGHDLFYYTPPNLSLHGDRLLARGETLKVTDKVGAHYKLSDPRVEDLSLWDVVLLRQDPPFDMAYITTTHLLERIHPKTLVVNDPAHVRNAPEKIFVLDFLDLMPPTLITRSLADVEAFRAEIQGRDLKAALRQRRRRHLPHRARATPTPPRWWSCSRPCSASRSWCSSTGPRLKTATSASSSSTARWRAPSTACPRRARRAPTCMSAAPRPPTKLTPRDEEICARLGPELKRRGLLFAGIDVIGPYLTEINVTSPTGIRQVKDFGGADIAALIWDAIEAKAGK